VNVSSSNGHNGNGQKQRNNRGIGYGNPPPGRPFQKGRSGNPNGRPKGVSLTTIIREVLAKPDKKHGTRGDALIAVAERRARKGDFRFFKEIIDRNDGKTPERFANADGENLTIEFIRGGQKQDSDSA
jgi:hypothetical protein